MSYEPTDEERARWTEHYKKVNKPTEIIEGIAKFRQAGAMLAACDGETEEGNAATEYGEASEELAWAIKTHAFCTFGHWMAYRHKGSVYAVVREGVGYLSADGGLIGPNEDRNDMDIVVFDDDNPLPSDLEVFDIPDDPFYATN